MYSRTITFAAPAAPAAPVVQRAKVRLTFDVEVDLTRMDVPTVASLAAEALSAICGVKATGPVAVSIQSLY